MSESAGSTVHPLQSSTLLGHRRRLNSPIWFGTILPRVFKAPDFSNHCLLPASSYFLLTTIKQKCNQGHFPPRLKLAMSFTAVYSSSGDMTRAAFGFLTEARLQHLEGSQFTV